MLTDARNGFKSSSQFVNYLFSFSHRIIFCIILLALWMVLAPLAVGQAAGTASVQGSITDATGAVIEGANVTLTDLATHVKREATSGSSGSYTFPNIPVGTYSLSVSRDGFQTYTRTGIVLEVGNSASVNISMTVGSATEHIEVQAEGLAMQTEDSTFKQTIDQQSMTEMPLNGRQMTNLITLSGGSTAAPGGDFTGSKFSYQTISISVAGGMGNTTMWRLDGGDNNDYMANGNLPFPFPDAVSQFSVESTALSAQNGMHTGGMVNVVTRSGTNTFHGSAFEFIRNNYLDATNFFSTSKDTLHQNQFGGTFGGPIVKNKLFAFAGYQRMVAKQSQANQQATVPTTANLAGDWSATDGPNCTASKTTISLVDPLTGVALVGNKYATQPVYNPQALSLMKYLPQINSASDPNNCGYVFYAIPSEKYDNQFVTRADYAINARHNLYGRYFIDGYQAPSFFSPNNILITSQSGSWQRVQSLTLGEAFTISSHTVNSMHLTVMRRRNNRGYAANDINANTLGINMYQALPNGIQVGVTNKFTVGGGTNTAAHFNDNTLAFDDDITMLRGKHQIVMGGQWVQNQLNISNGFNSNGQFTFGGNYSGNGPNGGRITGDNNLDFLMGAMSAFQQSKMQQNALRGPIPSLYIQETYHATSRLTLTGGLRWSPNFMPVDYFNRGTIFDMDAMAANQRSLKYPNAPAGTFFYGDKGVTRQFTRNTPWQFSPNVGVSYDPFGSGKTVVRAGGALGYDQVNYFTGQRNQQNPPFATAISQTQTTTSGPMSFSSPWSVGQITSNPFPMPIIPTPSTALFYPQSSYVVMDKKFSPSYMIQWTMSVQREFGRGWQAQVQYIGSHTLHAPIGVALSPAVYIPGTWGVGGTGCAGIVRTGTAAVSPGALGTPCSTTANQASRYKLTMANPVAGNQYGGGGSTALVVSENMANYNGMVASIQHRLSSTFSLMANYTWAKCLNIYDAQGDYAGPGAEQNANMSPDYGPCGSDYTHTENVVMVVRSDFHFARLASLIVNKWEFAPLVHIVSGAPFNVTAGQDISLTAVGADRPNRIQGVPVYLHQKIRSTAGQANRGYLNPAAFVPNAQAIAGTFGNVSRNAFRGPVAYQFDAQISRVFPIHENWAATLRLEAFNVLNHPNFSAPSGTTSTLSASTFGQLSSQNNAARVFQGSVKISF